MAKKSLSDSEEERPVIMVTHYPSCLPERCQRRGRDTAFTACENRRAVWELVKSVNDESVAVSGWVLAALVFSSSHFMNSSMLCRPDGKLWRAGRGPPAAGYTAAALFPFGYFTWEVSVFVFLSLLFSLICSQFKQGDVPFNLFFSLTSCDCCLFGGKHLMLSRNYIISASLIASFVQEQKHWNKKSTNTTERLHKNVVVPPARLQPDFSLSPQEIFFFLAWIAFWQQAGAPTVDWVLAKVRNGFL